MGKALILRDTQLERLRANTAQNSKRYELDEPWLSDYFGNEPWFLQSKIDIPDELELQVPGESTGLLDLENTRALYGALRHLTPLQAADERLWAHLSHVRFWKYMRSRWPVEQYKNKRVAEYLQERYLFDSDRGRALLRNGVARLWWYGYTTYDEQRADPFELTAVLLKNLDVTQSIAERAFSKNRAVTLAILAVLRDRENQGKAFYGREGIRDLAKYLVQLGGVTIIDALASDDVARLVDLKIDELSSKAA